MKAKLTISLDKELVPDAKRLARTQGVSLSRLIEDSLKAQIATEPRPSFSERWRGSFRPAQREDRRYEQLAKKYL